MMRSDSSAAAIAEALGQRLKQARLNHDRTQQELAEHIGVSRKTIVNAEKGKAQLEVFVAIMSALGLTQQLDLFLPEQPISPIQLAKLQGKKRQRAVAHKKPQPQGDPEW